MDPLARPRRTLAEDLPGALLVLTAAGALAWYLLATGEEAGSRGELLEEAARARNEAIASAEGRPGALRALVATSVGLLAAGAALWAFMGLRAAGARGLPDVLVLNWRRDLSPLADPRALWSGAGPAEPPGGAWAAAQVAAAFVLFHFLQWAAAAWLLGEDALVADPEGYLATTIALNALAVAWAAFFLTRRFGATLTEALDLRGPIAGHVAAGLVAFAMTAPLLWLAGMLSQLLRQSLGASEQAHPFMVYAEPGTSAAASALLLFAGVVVSPVAEELLFRRLIFGAMRRRLGLVLSAVASALVFALVHANSWDIPGLFVLGMMLALVYDRRRSLVAPIILHAANNAFMLVGMMVVRG